MTPLPADERDALLDPEHLRTVLAAAERVYALRLELNQRLGDKDPTFDTEEHMARSMRAFAELDEAIPHRAHFLMAVLPTVLRRGEMLRGTENDSHEECPTWYDGCHCDVETLVDNIEQVERAEDEVVQLREALAAMVQVYQDAVADGADVFRERMGAAAGTAMAALSLAKSRAETRNWHDTTRFATCPGCGAGLRVACNGNIGAPAAWVECESQRCEWSGPAVRFRGGNPDEIERMLVLRKERGNDDV